MPTLPENLHQLPRGHRVLSWQSQVVQYPRKGVPGVTLFSGQTPLGPVECLLWRDGKRTHVHGILNYYPTDQPPYERAGNVNVFVDPDWQRQGIATLLLDAALTRWPGIDPARQRYSPQGEAFARAYAARRTPTVVNPRACLECGVDLTDTMGCYVFVVDGTWVERAPGLLCVEHGGNGANSMSPAQYARLTGGAP